MKNLKSYAMVLGSLVLIFLLMTSWSFDNSGAFESILTFLSIIAGFSITALSIIATSEFSKDLYSKESQKNNSLTLLHELISIFKKATLLFVFNIMVILLFEFLPDFNLVIFKSNNYIITFCVFLKAVIWYMTILSFSAFIYLLLLFSKFVIRSASRK
jgi:hypothetical protein